MVQAIQVLRFHLLELEKVSNAFEIVDCLNTFQLGSSAPKWNLLRKISPDVIEYNIVSIIWGLDAGSMHGYQLSETCDASHALGPGRRIFGFWIIFKLCPLKTISKLELSLGQVSRRLVNGTGIGVRISNVVCFCRLSDSEFRSRTGPVSCECPRVRAIIVST